MNIHEQIEARIKAARESREAKGLAVRWIMADGRENYVLCPDEEYKQGWIANLKSKGLKVLD